MSDRVSFREGDLRETDWGAGYDLVLLFNIIHNLSKEESRKAMEKAYAALNPGGKIVVLDSEHSKGDKNLSMAGGFNELLFFLTSGTRAYPEATIREWMNSAGFKKLKTQRLLSVPMTCLITGKRD
jgi:SAM-dependent methyltransferase